MLSHPSLNDRHNHLRGAGDVDLAIDVSRRIDRTDHLDAQALIRQADGSNT
jgi:hypothetical protein